MTAEQMFFHRFKRIMSTEDLHTSDKIVFVLLHEYFDKPTAPFHNEMAETLGISRKTVQNAIARLREAGYIERTLWMPEGLNIEVSKYRPGPRYHEIGKAPTISPEDWWNSLTDEEKRLQLESPKTFNIPQ